MTQPTEPIEQLVRNYCITLPNRCKQIQLLWTKASEKGFMGDSWQGFLRSIHMLVGSGSSFGQPKVTEIARQIEDLLLKRPDPKAPIPDQLKQHVVQKLILLLKLAQQIHEAAERGQLDIKAIAQQLPSLSDKARSSPESARTNSSERRGSQPLKTIYIVDDDQDQCKLIASQVKAHGFNVSTFFRLSELRDAVLQSPPSAIISDIMFPEGEVAGIEAIGALRKTSEQPIPIIFASGRVDAKTRLLALRAGGDAYYTKPLPMAELVIKLHELTNKFDERPYRVLMIDDDIIVTELYTAMLRKAGCVVQSITDPTKALNACFDFRPELILLDLHMPHLNGIELARQIRKEESFISTPMVFLSADKNESHQQKAIDSGALDFLVKPVGQENLISTVKNRIDSARKTTEKSTYLGRIDPVTGLYNRNYFISHLAHHISHAKDKPPPVLRPALVYLELNNYLSIVQKLGDEKSKLLRAQLGRLIKDSAQEHDTTASFSHNVFTLLVHRSTTSHIKEYCQTLIDKIIQSCIQFEAALPAVTISIGIARLIGDDYNRILSAATTACSVAQDRGPNQIQIHDSLDGQSDKERKVRSHVLLLKTAIKEKRLFLVFQPIANLSGDAIERYEVNVRMRDQKGDVMTPRQFLTTAEKVGLMKTIDRWVILHSLNLLTQQQKKSPKEVIFFVKLSPNTINDPRFIDWLKEVSHKFKIKPNTLILEFPEVSMHAYSGSTRVVMQHVKALNIEVAIEHFGLHKKSLELLHQYPVRYIKLDRMLVHMVEENQENEDKIRSIIKLADQKNIHTIAGYVFTAPCLATLCQLGVHYVQGDFLQQPSELMNYDFDTLTQFHEPV